MREDGEAHEEHGDMQQEQGKPGQRHNGKQPKQTPHINNIHSHHNHIMCVDMDAIMQAYRDMAQLNG